MIDLTPEYYNVTLAEAAEASISTPGYFNPYFLGEEALVDGMIVANNPSMYAFILAKNITQSENMRVVSVGAGTNPPVTIDPTSTNALTWGLNIQDLLINTEITTHVFMTARLAQDYYRFQVETTDVSISDLNGDSI